MSWPAHFLRGTGWKRQSVNMIAHWTLPAPMCAIRWVLSTTLLFLIAALEKNIPFNPKNLMNNYEELDTYKVSLHNEVPPREEEITEIQDRATADLLCYANPGKEILITRAVNCHNDLVKALELFVAQYEGNGRDERELRPEMLAARAALAKVKSYGMAIADEPTNCIRDVSGRSLFVGSRAPIGELLEQAVEAGVDLTGANLEGANLTDRDLSGAKLSRAFMVGANTCYTNFNGADLSGAAMNNANSQNASFEGANMRCISLKRADVSFSNMRGVNLISADVTEAGMDCVDLSGANVAGVDLDRAGSMMNLIANGMKFEEPTPWNCTQSYAEGWSLFDDGSKEEGLYAIQRLDSGRIINGKQTDDVPFVDDVAARAYVRARAEAGSPYHIQALSLCQYALSNVEPVVAGPKI